jgi:ribosome production factor 1
LPLPPGPIFFFIVSSWFRGRPTPPGGGGVSSAPPPPPPPPPACPQCTNFLAASSIANHGNPTGHKPEVILNGFTTRLGHRIGRLLGSTLPHDPEFKGRRVVTFHNQRDFIFLRHHRYIFNDDGSKARLQELGPRFTLKLRWLQAGTFDTQHGEYEWLHKRAEMDTSRRKFFL